MTQTYETGYNSTLALPLTVAATTMTVATAPTVTKGAIKLGRGVLEEWVTFTGVSGTTLTGLTRGLSKTAIPATAGTGLSWVAGTAIKLVAMHDQLDDRKEDATIPGAKTFSETINLTKGVGSTVYASTAARDTALGGNGVATKAYTAIQAGGNFYNYNTATAQWEVQSTGTATANASETVAGKVEIGTSSEVISGTATGGTGAIVVVDAPTYVTATELYHGIDTISNFTIGATRGSNAETVSLLTKAGTAPSATDPIHIGFRNVTAGTGDYTIATITSALTVVINNTATMGATNAVPFRLRLVAFNTAGTISLGIVNTQLSEGGIFQLNEDSFGTSTTIGTGADSAGVIYSTAGVTAKAYKILGYLDYTLAAVGVWDTAPTKIQMYGRGVKLPGAVIQSVLTQTGAVATGATIVPWDDTIPQITEGNEFMTQAVTPLSGANKLRIESSARLYFANGCHYVSALFQDSTANALSCNNIEENGNQGELVISIDYTMTANTTSSTTFRIRCGSDQVGTMTFNGSGGGRKYGGVLNSFLRVTEIMV